MCRVPKGRLVLALSLAVTLPGARAGSQDCPDGPASPGRPALALRAVAAGFDRPVDVQAPRGDPRLFVVEQPGRIRVLREGGVLPMPFLDITDRVLDGGERGLLGLAFHPDYAENGRFYVDYTDLAGDTRIVEFRVRSDAPDRADPGSEYHLLGVRQPFANHNGGALAFGPDGYLYVALGDGGSGGDPLGNAQDRASPLGKILRLDVDAVDPVAAPPPGNPFLDDPEAFPLIWALGLRNPWRIAFDAATGDLYIGDVGQDRVEEIDVGLAARGGGENYGWNVREGSLCFDPPSRCAADGLIPPVVEYDHSGGSCSVTGGVVYRGCRMPGWAGTYFYADFCSGFVRSFRLQEGAAVEPLDWGATFDPEGRLRNVTSFGVDGAGEIHLVDAAGTLYRIVPAE